MKKILLITGIISFTAASAQQNDFFDIQKYLEKKNQTKPLSLLKKPEQKAPLVQKPSITVPFHWSPILGQATLSHTLSDGSKVYSLPLDNMPCIVPDMSQFNTPNAYHHIPNNYFADSLQSRDLLGQILTPKRNLPGQIPNAITPWKIIPDSK